MANDSTLKKLLRAFAKWVGYPLFFLFTFVVFSYWTFPWGRLRDRIIFEVENPSGPDGRRHPSGYQLEIASLGPSGISGVEAAGVKLTKNAENPDDLPMEINFAEVEAHVGLFSLLFGALALDFDARVAGGTISGEVEVDGPELDADIAIADIRLRRAGIIRAFFSLPLEGRVSGDIELGVREDVTQSTGAIQLDISGLEIGDDRAKLAFGTMRDGLTVPRLVAGDVVVRAEVQEGALVFQRLQSRGDDLDLDGEGEITLASPFPRSRLNLLLRTGFKDSYRERNDRTRALFSLLDLNPQGRAAKTPDGALQFRLAGTISGRVNAQPAGRSAPPASAARGGGAPASMSADMATDMAADMAAETAE